MGAWGPQMSLDLENWRSQEEIWPQCGRHILAQFDDDSIVVNQAYSPAIADWAVEHQAFGGPWSFSRMSWIKPNFLWMMYRSGWARKPGQERVLAVRMLRTGFDHVLEIAKESRAPAGHTVESWRSVLQGSDVRLQWDPDHAPGGDRLERRAIQLGLRGETLRKYALEWALEIEDITGIAHAQFEKLEEHGLDALETPKERIYRPRGHPPGFRPPEPG